ncbi:MAG TPA: VCBS repeat-containing protein [Ktedonobacteraceae bacterium]|jgi:hypothetical protein
MGSGGDLSKQHRPIDKNTEGGRPILIPRNTSEDVMPAMKSDGFLGDDGDPPRHNTSAIRLDFPSDLRNRTTGSHQPTSAIPSRRQQVPTKNVPMRPAPRPTSPTQKKKSPEEHSHFNVHWLLPVGITMVVLVILWMVGSAALAWGHQRLDDLQYGNPRTYQTDKVVGHADSPKNPSHFIALNLHSQIIVVEFMGGNPQKAVTYVTPVFIAGSNSDLAPVTLEFRDVNGDGKLDMLVHIHLSGQDQVTVFINDGNKFRPSNGSDKITI